ncbi:hypothetical protein FBULB1_291 [Fusarium bulbicola]|nr:hypothetical protein FBULB1_291 [Fusarium bulbicola]
MDHVPNEILGHILSFLLTEKERHRLHDDTIDHILPVRLVCRRWNYLAIKHLFRTITLQQSDATLGSDFRSWRQLLGNDSIKAAVRRVTIETTPESHFRELHKVNAFCAEPWNSSDYWNAFQVALQRICDMPNLNSVAVRFSEKYEPTSARSEVLEMISRALELRESRPNTSIVRELVLFNLEDTPLSTHVTDKLFRNIERLHMSFDCGGFDGFVQDEFIPYLSDTLLPSVPERLVELTLSGCFWGAVPDEFNTGDLSFPRLRTLTLDGFVILRQGQFDWVLQQRSLVDLRLYNCQIASHWLVQDQQDQLLATSLNGWEYLPDTYTDVDMPGFASFGPLRPRWHVNKLRWSTIFDRVSSILTLLRNFTFKRSHWQIYFEDVPDYFKEDELSERYCTFDDEYCWETTFFEPFDQRRCLDAYFRDNDKEGSPVGFYTRTEPADRQALEKLREVTRKRRDGE